MMDRRAGGRGILPPVRLIRFVIDAEGRVEGVGMGPASQAPQTDGDTCGVPPRFS